MHETPGIAAYHTVVSSALDSLLDANKDYCLKASEFVGLYSASKRFLGEICRSRAQKSLLPAAADVLEQGHAV